MTDPLNPMKLLAAQAHFCAEFSVVPTGLHGPRVSQSLDAEPQM